MSKPKEWRINQMGSYDSCDQIYGPALTEVESVHVIEYSAYAKLQAEIEELRATEKVYNMNRDWIAEAKKKMAFQAQEIERLNSDYWVRKGKGAQTISDENKRIYALLEVEEKKTAELRAETEQLHKEMVSSQPYYYEEWKKLKNIAESYRSMLANLIEAWNDLYVHVTDRAIDGNAQHFMKVKLIADEAKAALESGEEK